MDTLQIIMSVLVGVGLSAACGFRVFVPLLIMCIANKSGLLSFGSEFSWMGSNIALVTFSIATILEVAAYYIPWLDNALDTISCPSAAVAGTIVTSAMLSGIDPWFQWSLALIAGGGTACATQATTSVIRATSSISTGGTANWVVSTGEVILSVFVSILAIFLPIFMIGVLLAIIYFTFNKKSVRMQFGKK